MVEKEFYGSGTFTEPGIYQITTKVDRDNCVICSNEIEEGEPFEVYGSAINPRYAHEKCRIEDDRDKLQDADDKFFKYCIREKFDKLSEIDIILGDGEWLIGIAERAGYVKLSAEMRKDLNIK